MPEFGFARKASPAPAPVVPLAEDEVSVSASQFKDFKRCKRLWWLKKVAKVKEREKQHLHIGHVLHSRAEIYQTGLPGQELYPEGWDKGLTKDEAQWVIQSTDRAISLGLWQRVPGRLVEYPLCLLVGNHVTDFRGMPLVARAETYTGADGVRKVKQPTALLDGSPLPLAWDKLPVLKGFMDVYDRDQYAPGVQDHKSAKSRRYALTPEKLGKDTQMLNYSAAVLSMTPTAEMVKLRHNVFLKDPNAPEPAYAVDAVAGPVTVARHWKEMIEWSEIMFALRRDHPGGQGSKRADLWHQVEGAINAGKNDECETYGGCPFRDLCFGRCTAEQIVNRYDSPDPVKLVQQAEVSFGLRPSPTKEKPTMAFNRPSPSLTECQDVYILDPENAAVQYRARIDRLNIEPGQSTIALWPNPDVEPDFTSLGIHYRIIVPNSALMVVPLATAKVTGYFDALVAAGEPADAVQWQPSAKVKAVSPAVETVKAPEKPASDGQFGLRPAGTAAPALATAPAASEPAQDSGVVYNGAGATVGMSLVVAENKGSAFWAKLVGKKATIVEITDGMTPGTVMFTVEIDGHPYPDVLPSRFNVPGNSLAAVAVANSGKIVHVEMVDGTSLNVPVEAVSNDGFATLAGSKKLLFAEMKSLVPFNEKEHVPQRQPTPEEKKEAKEAAKEAKAAEKAAEKAAAKEAPAGEGVTPSAPATAEQALDQAITLCDEALTKGKVTRKIIEGILPLLKMVKEKGTGSTGVSNYTGVAHYMGESQVIAPAPGDTQIRGAIKVALTHAIGVLNEALGKISE